MANLTEEAKWEEGIYQFEQTDVVQGGPEGIDNVPTRQLANRTGYLKQEQDALKNKFDSEETPDPLPQYAKSATAQMLPYNPARTYKQNETCTTFNATTGELQIWTSYAPTDNTGNDPQDPANRHDEWPNFPTPCWWIKHHAVEPGTPVYWFSDDIPENALQIMDTDIDAGFYHRIANAYPSLVADGKINLADILGRYVRIADGVDYLVNTTHEDAIRNITGSVDAALDFNTADGAFQRSNYATNKQQNSSGESGWHKFIFDASRVVPTASQNQPKSTMANLIIFM